jgi:hypothetical protein
MPKPTAQHRVGAIARAARPRVRDKVGEQPLGLDSRAAGGADVELDRLVLHAPNTPLGRRGDGLCDQPLTAHAAADSGWNQRVDRARPGINAAVRSFLVIVALAAGTLACAAGAVEAATTPATYQLTVNAGGDGSGTIRGSSIDCYPQDGKPVGPCEITENAGNTVTLTATADQGSVFTGWSGGGCSGTGACTVTLSSNVTVTASFKLSTVRAKGGTLAVSPSQHTTSVRMTCRGPGSCSGSVELSGKRSGQMVKFASARYTIANGRTSAIALTLNGTGISMISKSGNRLRATLTVTPVDGPTTNTGVTLKL